MAIELSEKAMLTRLSISQWIACKNDKVISEKVAKDYNAEIESGRYNKMLAPLKELKSVSKISNKARNFNYINTLPWGKDGSRLLPTENFKLYADEMRKFKTNFEEAVDIIISKYQEIKDSSKIRLGNMYNDKDYPLSEELINKYRFHISINPLPNVEDFRISLQENEINAIKTNIENRLKNSQNIAMLDLWQRLFSNVSHMSNKLNDEDSHFRKSLVNNLTDICSLLPKLNIMQDPQLEKMRYEVEEKLCTYSAETLRNDENKRRKIGNEAKNILTNINDLILNSTYKKELEYNNDDDDILNAMSGYIKNNEQ